MNALHRARFSPAQTPQTAIRMRFAQVFLGDAAGKECSRLTPKQGDENVTRVAAALGCSLSGMQEMASWQGFLQSAGDTVLTVKCHTIAPDTGAEGRKPSVCWHS